MKPYNTLCLSLALALALNACTQPSSKQPPAAANNVAVSPDASSSAAAPAPSQASTSGTAPIPIPIPVPVPAPVPKTRELRINATRSMQYTREIVAIGPRPIGSHGHARLEAYLRSHLKTTAGNVMEDAFTAQTPAGPFAMRNFIAQYPGTKDGIIVIASHYDTMLPVKNFVGANDGGSSTGLLLELANQFHSQGKLPGYSVWLVFLDGEEAVKEWSDTDSV